MLDIKFQNIVVEILIEDYKKVRFRRTQLLSGLRQKDHQRRSFVPFKGIVYYFGKYASSWPERILYYLYYYYIYDINIQTCE